jgi:malonyl CoA-acyl carrier protein transacylase
MTAVTGLSFDELKHFLDPYIAEATDKKSDNSSTFFEPNISSVQTVVSIAAVNAATQLTLTGDADAVKEISQMLIRQFPNAQTTPLRVSGAWHSNHMTKAQLEFETILNKTSIAAPKIPLSFNADGRSDSDPTSIRIRLATQLISPVRFDLVMKSMVEKEITDIIEIGPGKVIRGLVRLNDPEGRFTVHNVSDARSLARVVETLR